MRDFSEDFLADKLDKAIARRRAALQARPVTRFSEAGANEQLGFDVQLLKPERPGRAGNKVRFSVSCPRCRRRHRVAVIDESLHVGCLCDLPFTWRYPFVKSESTWEIRQVKVLDKLTGVEVFSIELAEPWRWKRLG